jgi:hypothetical protein
LQAQSTELLLTEPTRTLRANRAMHNREHVTPHNVITVKLPVNRATGHQEASELPRATYIIKYYCANKS